MKNGSVKKDEEAVFFRELKKKADMLEKIIELNPYSIQINDAEGHYLRGNKAFVELFGSAPPPSYTTFNDPVLAKMGLKEALLGIKKGKTVTIPCIPYNAHWADPAAPDKLCYGRAVFTPIMGNDGKLENILIMHEDITARYQAETALKESEEKYRSVVESSLDGIAVIDKNGKMVFLNKALAQMLGVEVADMMGHNFIEFTHPSSHAIAMDVFNKFFGGQDTFRFEAALIHRDGRQIDVEDFVSPIVYKGERAGLVIVRDIMERKAAESALKEKVQQLAKANRLMVGRELKMIELKKQLEKDGGQKDQ